MYVLFKSEGHRGTMGSIEYRQMKVNDVVLLILLEYISTDI